MDGAYLAFRFPRCRHCTTPLAVSAKSAQSWSGNPLLTWVLEVKSNCRINTNTKTHSNVNYPLFHIHNAHTILIRSERSIFLHFAHYLLWFFFFWSIIVGTGSFVHSLPSSVHTHTTISFEWRHTIANVQVDRKNRKKQNSKDSAIVFVQFDRMQTVYKIRWLFCHWINRFCLSCSFRCK